MHNRGRDRGRDRRRGGGKGAIGIRGVDREAEQHRGRRWRGHRVSGSGGADVGIGEYRADYQHPGDEGNESDGTWHTGRVEVRASAASQKVLIDL